MGPPTPRGLIVCSLLAEGLQSRGWDSEAYPIGTGLLLSGDCSWNKCVCPAQNTASTCAHVLGAPQAHTVSTHCFSVTVDAHNHVYLHACEQSTVTSLIPSGQSCPSSSPTHPLDNCWAPW